MDQQNLHPDISVVAAPGAGASRELSQLLADFLVAELSWFTAHMWLGLAQLSVAMTSAMSRL